MKQRILVLLTLTVLLLTSILPGPRTKGQSSGLQCLPYDSTIRTEIVDIRVGLSGEVLKGKFYFSVPKNAAVGT